MNDAIMLLNELWKYPNGGILEINAFYRVAMVKLPSNLHGRHSTEKK